MFPTLTESLSTTLLLFRKKKIKTPFFRDGSEREMGNVREVVNIHSNL